MGPALEFGDRFIRQVYVLTICLTVVIAVVLLIFKRMATPSFLIGSTIGLSMFWSIEFVIRGLVRPGKTQKTKYLLGFIALGKYTVLGVLLYFLFNKAGWLNIYAFGGGIILVQAAIILKAIGLMITILRKKDPDQP